MIHKNKFIWYLFFLALSLRFLLFAINFQSSGHDLVTTIHGDDGYYEISANLVKGNGFSGDPHEPYRPNPLRPPVYPLFLAGILLIFKSYWATLIVQALLGSAIPVLSYLIAQRFLEEKWAKVIGVAMALEPFTILLSIIYYTETFFTFFFLLSCHIMFSYLGNPRMRTLVWSAVFFSLALLIKPTIQYLPFLIPFIFYFNFKKSFDLKKIATHSLIFMVIVGIFALPWLYRNHREFGVWGMSAQPAYNIFMYLAPSAMSLQKGITLQETMKYISGVDNFDDSQINLSNGDQFTTRGIEVIKENPQGLIKSILITGVTFFTHDGMLTVLQHMGIKPDVYIGKPAITLALSHPIQFIKLLGGYVMSPLVFILFFRLFWIIVTLGFVWGAYKYLRTKASVLSVVVIGLVIYFAATTSINGLGVNARFRVPVNPFILTFALYGFLVTWYSIKAKLKIHAKAFDSNTSV